MLKSSIKAGIFSAFNRIFGSKLTRKAHNFYKNSFDTDSRFEKELIAKTLSYVSEEATVLDIGANIGRWAIPLAKKIGEKGEVIAFEPNPETFQFLKNRVASRPNVLTYNIALSDQPKSQLEFLVQKGISCPPNAAIAETATQIKDRGNFELIKVGCESLDNFIKTHQIHKLDFVKIDVEGHELEVIKGFKEGIKRYKPIIAIEILASKWINNKAQDSEVAQLILQQGYKMGQFNETNKEYVFEIDLFESSFQNFIFVSG
ncbi:FkbM family methyltransferase [Flagellimonas flava]|uniref:Methyltransferase, FkbM family n=1 Tax=Flagellimonas flava TaxID=570519 RepID=A0A1M5L1K0_9FLAO|nr:FkbM family methyltransferase [Allomuricauda flava]SHG58866.1 methyltransferase, FkbM family [Allomuricauda flava]